jgi:hypothetical protein
MVDHERIGLNRVIAVVDFADQYKPFAHTILTAMNELCYVVGFAKTIPRGLFVVQASVPKDFVGLFKGLFEKLVEKGLFRTARFFDFDFFRNLPMRAEFYDFTSGRWDFDWSSENSGSLDVGTYAISEQKEFDYIDLLIVKEFQMDANKTLVGIANKLEINYKVLAWHFVNHVCNKKLIRGYRVNWFGTTYDYKFDKALHRKHRYVTVDVLASDLTEHERISLTARINRLPFLWAVAGGKDFYAQIAVPVDDVNEALQYIERTLEPVRERVEYYILDQTSGLAFTISYQLFDRSVKKWTFDTVTLINRFENLLIEIGNRV